MDAWIKIIDGKGNEIGIEGPVGMDSRLILDRLFEELPEATVAVIDGSCDPGNVVIFPDWTRRGKQPRGFKIRSVFEDIRCWVSSENRSELIRLKG